VLWNEANFRNIGKYKSLYIISQRLSIKSSSGECKPPAVLH